MAKNMTWTEYEIRTLLESNDRAVERAMIALYDRQTQDEKATSDTHHTNGRGFSGAHASKGSYYARWVLSGRKLSRHHLDNARRIALKYLRQLTEEANKKTSTAKVTEERVNERFYTNERAHKKSKVSAQEWMRKNGASETEIAKVEANIAAGRCPDGCCGPEEREEYEPKPGTLAFTARLLAEHGIMSGEEADAWKDAMKEDTGY